jgi:hypothetical protein
MHILFVQMCRKDKTQERNEQTKQTNKQTNKQTKTKTNKTKQNKHKSMYVCPCYFVIIFFKYNG